MAPGRYTCAVGSATRMRAPPPGPASAPILPPCASVIARYREPETRATRRAAARALDAIEGLEHRRPLERGDAGAIVVDEHRDLRG